MTHWDPIKRLENTPVPVIVPRNSHLIFLKYNATYIFAYMNISVHPRNYNEQPIERRNFTAFRFSHLE